MIAFAVFLMFGFAGMWPAWLERALRLATGAAMLVTMGFALFLGIVVAYILIVRPRR
ncbi:hypothetical protein [Thermomonas flagellata]|uniref:hypothetical protein n=1 Tax=Thermomonas flagellata TaxID=2888524 RepID=UPI001F04DEDF|nr:hypothetical protein [Thermomonas flagellata]